MSHFGLIGVIILVTLLSSCRVNSEKQSDIFGTWNLSEPSKQLLDTIGKTQGEIDSMGLHFDPNGKCTYSMPSLGLRGDFQGNGKWERPTSKTVLIIGDQPEKGSYIDLTFSDDEIMFGWGDPDNGEFIIFVKE